MTQKMNLKKDAFTSTPKNAGLSARTSKLSVKIKGYCTEFIQVLAVFEPYAHALSVCINRNIMKLVYITHVPRRLYFPALQ